MVEQSVNYNDPNNGWSVTIFWECDYGDTTASVRWEVNENSYGRTFQIVSSSDTSDRYDNYCTLNVGSAYYLYVYRYGSYSQKDGPFIITAPDPPGYTITYDANGGYGTPLNQTKTHGDSITLSIVRPIKSDVSAEYYTVSLDANGGTCDTSYLSAERVTSYTFIEWNTNSSGTGTSYTPGQTYSADTDLYLYAIYAPSTSTESVILPTPIRSGFTFLGWAVSPSATSGIIGNYEPEEKDEKLYAIWGTEGLVYIYDGTSFAAYQIFIYDGVSWNMYCPYIYDGSAWSMCS